MSELQACHIVAAMVSFKLVCAIVFISVGHHCFNECAIVSSIVPSSPSAHIWGQVYAEPNIFVVIFYLLLAIGR